MWCSAEPHPNSDHLKVCKVDAGTGTLIDVVCGAPNAVTGMKSVFAFPGTYIPGKDFTLKEGVMIRGALSNGMLCSAAELELSNDHDGIIVLPDDAPIGMPYVEYAGIGGVVFDISITPNRGDATGIYGVARDLAAYGLGDAEPDRPATWRRCPRRGRARSRRCRSSSRRASPRRSASSRGATSRVSRTGRRRSGCRSGCAMSGCDRSTRWPISPISCRRAGAGRCMPMMRTRSRARCCCAMRAPAKSSTASTGASTSSTRRCA